jgi:hypothetical protein
MWLMKEEDEEADEGIVARCLLSGRRLAGVIHHRLHLHAFRGQELPSR